MLFPSLISVFLLSITCISLFSPLISAAKTLCKGLKTRHPNHFDAAVDALGFSHEVFFLGVEIMSRACSTRFLTKDAMFAVIQQSIHAILRRLFGKYRLTEYSHSTYEMDLDEQPNIEDVLDNNDIENINNRFIGFTEGQGCLVVVRILQRGQKSIRICKDYRVNVQLPPVKVLYRKMIASGIDLNFMLRLFPLIISSYKFNLNIQAPYIPDLTNTMNNFVKEFIWKYCQEKGEKVEKPSVSTMKHLAKEFFKKTLDAQLYTVRQGHDGCLYGHVVVKPLTVSENKTLSTIYYEMNNIKLIEQHKLPVYPFSMYKDLQDSIFYCIYTYNLNEDKDIKVKSFKKYEKGKPTSLIKSAIPLTRVPENTVLITYLVFPTDHLLDLIISDQRNQMYCSKEMRDMDKDQVNQDISFSSSPSMISDEQLRIFMHYFAKYLYTSANTYLIER